MARVGAAAPQVKNKMVHLVCTVNLVNVQRTFMSAGENLRIPWFLRGYDTVCTGSHPRK